MKSVLLLALSAPLLASPVPRSDVTVRYTPNYPNAPTPRAPLRKDTPQDPTLTNDYDGILSEERPLPSIVLMNLPLGNEDEGEGKAPVVEARESGGLGGKPEAHRPDTCTWLDGAKVCPFAALVVFWTAGFLVCAIQRYVQLLRNPLLHPDSS
ncbi:hypothetical protein IMZ48_21790 [Candidatus Bathyarchaeota archaeon]|nr:hypothetical protein [Candidatus Bathyarchaeota archaeon]